MVNHKHECFVENCACKTVRNVGDMTKLPFSNPLPDQCFMEDLFDGNYER